MDDERRHTMDTRERIRQALRDWLRRGKIEVYQRTDADLDAETRPTEQGGQPEATKGGAIKPNRVFDIIAWVFRF